MILAWNIIRNSYFVFFTWKCEPHLHLNIHPHLTFSFLLFITLYLSSEDFILSHDMMTTSLEMISQNIFNKCLFWPVVLYSQLSLNAMTSSWWFKVGHDGSIHTRTIAKCYKLHSPFLEEVVKFLPAQHSHTSNKHVLDRPNLSSQTSSTALGFRLFP